MAGDVLEFSDANFQTEVLDSAEPVLVDFWAPWCGPCKQMLPTIEALAEELSGSVKVGKLNTDENPQTAQTYQITAIPTVLLFKGGEVVDRKMGVTPMNAFREVVNDHA